MTDAARISVVVADDYSLFRTGLVELLSTLADICVIGQASDGRSAVAVVTDVQPDVLVLDVEMPGPGASTTIDHIRAVSPKTRIVILTMHDDPDLVHHLISQGASAYLLKSATRTELANAITTAAGAEDTVVLSLPRATVQKLTNVLTATKPLLSPRELAVLTLIHEGHTNHHVGVELNISEGTVKKHVTNIYTKLGVLSRVSAIRRAEELGILSNDPAKPWL